MAEENQEKQEIKVGEEEVVAVAVEPLAAPSVVFNFNGIPVDAFSANPFGTDPSTFNPNIFNQNNAFSAERQEGVGGFFVSQEGQDCSAVGFQFPQAVAAAQYVVMNPGEGFSVQERLIITREVVAAVLTLDDISRRRRQWRLVSDQEFQMSQMEHVRKTDAPARGRGRRNQTRESIGRPQIAPDLVSIGSHGYRNAIVTRNEPVTSLAVQILLFKLRDCFSCYDFLTLFRWFPLLENIFNASEGKLIAAGGALTYAVAAASTASSGGHFTPYNIDVDLFMVGVAAHDASAYLSRICKVCKTKRSKKSTFFPG
jgi:hypothetical protein